MCVLSPKLNLLYYKNIVDCAIKGFVSANNDMFVKDGDNYVFAKSITRQMLMKRMKVFVLNELGKYIEPYSILNPNHYFIIGSCFPKDNILLSRASESKYFPEKLKKLIQRPDNLKYILKEKDIKIDIEMFNCVLEDIFNNLFRNSKKLDNIHFIRHNRLDCYAMYRIIKDGYGASNVVNLHKKHMSNIKSAIYSVNEMIDLYVHGKKEVIRSSELEFIRAEIIQFVNKSMGLCNG